MKTVLATAANYTEVNPVSLTDAGGVLSIIPGGADEYNHRYVWLAPGAELGETLLVRQLPRVNPQTGGPASTVLAIAPTNPNLLPQFAMELTDLQAGGTLWQYGPALVFINHDHIEPTDPAYTGPVPGAALLTWVDPYWIVSAKTKGIYVGASLPLPSPL